VLGNLQVVLVGGDPAHAPVEPRAGRDPGRRVGM